MKRTVSNLHTCAAGAIVLWTLLWGAGAVAETPSIDASAETAAQAPEGPATAYYRWIDDEGRVQYTDFEPVGIPSQLIPLAAASEDDAPAISRADGDRPPDPFHDQDQQILPIEHIGPCADARARLAVLHADVPVYRTETGQYRAAWRGDTYRGERTWLDAEERCGDSLVALRRVVNVD